MYRRMRPSFILFIVVLMATSCNEHSSHSKKFITAYDKAHFEAYPYPLTHSDTLIVEDYYDGDFEAYLDYRLKNMERFRDKYTWQRAGNHLLVGPEKARQMAEKLGFDCPYYFIQYLKCDTIDNAMRKEIIEGIHGRLAERDIYTGYQNTQFNTADLMGVALRNSATGQKDLITNRKEAFQKHYIEVDFEKVDKRIQSGRMSEEEKKMKVNKVYAAFFRAYKFLEIENGLYQLKVESGKEIGISPTLFKIIKATFDQTNEGILKARKQNPDRTIDGKADGVVGREQWDWDLCMGLYEKYAK